jgi:hypothetical protein
VTALTVGITTPTTSPTSNAAAGVLTTGPLFDLAGALGRSVEDLLPADIQALVNTLGLIENVPADPLDLNDAINGVSFVPVVNSRSVLVVSIGLGSFAATQAYQALRSSAQGNTLPGFSAPSSRGR